MPPLARANPATQPSATIGCEAELWLTGEGDVRGRVVLEYEAKFHVASEAKNNIVALSGQLFESTQVSFCPWFLGKSEAAGKSRAASELELAFAA